MKKNIVKFLLILVAVLSFFLMAVGSESSDFDTTDSSKASSSTEKIEVTTKLQESTQTSFSVGETLVTKSTKIVYISSNVFESDNMFIQPKDGYEYKYITLFVENISSSDLTVSYFDFNCYADGYACDQCYSMDDQLSATLSPGRTATGTICFEVPASATKIEFEYEEGLLVTKKYVFVYEGIKDSGLKPSGNNQETANAHKVGDVISTSDEKITYVSFGEYVSDNMFLQPKDGYKYIYLEFEFENIGKTDDIITSSSFECYADGSSCDAHYFGDDTLSATISPGRKAKGKVYFEIPVSASVVEVEYKENIFSSKKIVFALK